jgi:hypothetical protein
MDVAKDEMESLVVTLFCVDTVQSFGKLLGNEHSNS